MQDTYGQSPQVMLDATAGRPDAPRGPLVLLLIWCAIEGTVFAFALRPTMSELLSDLVGFNVNPIVLIALLSIFLTLFIAGSFACIHVLNDAIQAKRIGIVVQMILVQLTVAMFQILFLYEKLIDALRPWLAEAGLALGNVATLALAACAWVAVRGMTWYLFGRRGASALVPLLNRQAGTPAST